jgi:hypothetical protein
VFKKFTCIFVWGEGVWGEAGASWPSKGAAASKIVSKPYIQRFGLKVLDIVNFCTISAPLDCK